MISYILDYFLQDTEPLSPLSELLPSDQALQEFWSNKLKNWPALIVSPKKVLQVFVLVVLYGIKNTTTFFSVQVINFITNLFSDTIYGPVLKQFFNVVKSESSKKQLLYRTHLFNIFVWFSDLLVVPWDAIIQAKIERVQNWET